MVIEIYATKVKLFLAFNIFVYLRKNELVCSHKKVNLPFSLSNYFYKTNIEILTSHRKFTLNIKIFKKIIDF